MTIDLEAIKAREEAASPGPWPERAIEFAFWTIRKKGPPILGGQGARDIDFLAHARADIPALIAEIERLRKLGGGHSVMTTQFPEPPTTDIEQWAERYAPHQLTAYQYSDACEYMGFEEWLDLNHPGVLSEFEAQHKGEHP